MEKLSRGLLKRRKLNKGYWKNEANQRKFIRRLCKELNIEKDEDWYGVNCNAIYKRGGSGFLSHYKGSLYAALKHLFPEKDLLPWYFDLPKNYWNEYRHQRRYMEWLADTFHIEKQEDWSLITTQEIHARGGSTLLHQYNGFLLSALRSIFPEYEWHPWLFQHIPQYFWNDRNSTNRPQSFWADKSNQKLYFRWLGSKLNIKEENLDGWYSITKELVKKNGGATLLKHYNNSLHSALQEVYPQREWHPWLFHQVPKRFWSQTENQKKCLDWLAEKLHIRSQSEWYNVRIKNIVQQGGGGLLKNHGDSLLRTLTFVYPQYRWSPSEKSSFGQQYVHKLLQKYFHSSDIRVNYKHPELVRNKSGLNMELDLYVPSVRLAIEFQGQQHYESSYRGYEPQHQHLRDEEKWTACKNSGITLVTVPYWWDFSESSFLSTINRCISNSSSLNASV